MVTGGVNRANVKELLVPNAYIQREILACNLNERSVTRNLLTIRSFNTIIIQCASLILVLRDALELWGSIVIFLSLKKDAGLFVTFYSTRV